MYIILYICCYCFLFCVHHASRRSSSLLQFLFQKIFFRQLCLRCLYHLIENPIIIICNQHVYKSKFNAFIMHQEKKTLMRLLRQTKKENLFIFIIEVICLFSQCKFISMQYNKKINRLLTFAQEIFSIEIIIKNSQFAFKLQNCSQICEHEQCATRCQTSRN